MISNEQLTQVGKSASQAMVISEQLVMQFRQTFPDIHFTYCMDDDVAIAKPVYEDERFNLYLLDSRNHCLCFTEQSDIATGIVVAEIEA